MLCFRGEFSVCKYVEIECTSETDNNVLCLCWINTHMCCVILCLVSSVYNFDARKMYTIHSDLAMKMLDFLFNKNISWYFVLCFVYLEIAWGYVHNSNRLRFMECRIDNIFSLYAINISHVKYVSRCAAVNLRKTLIFVLRENRMALMFSRNCSYTFFFINFPESIYGTFYKFRGSWDIVDENWVELRTQFEEVETDFRFSAAFRQ